MLEVGEAVHRRLAAVQAVLVALVVVVGVQLGLPEPLEQ
jgi:hypothetical protein